MEGWMWAIALKPMGLIFFLFFVGVIANALKPLIPASNFKTLIYDKTFRDRKPQVVIALIAGFYLVFLTTMGIVSGHL